MNQGRKSARDVTRKRVFLVVCACFLLSGFAALLYETVWLRQFAIILGTSEQALAVILGAYMGGLSFGAWVASRTTALIQKPLLTYGILEAGIALCALAMPVGLSIVQWLQVKLFGGSPEPPAAGSLPMVLFGLVSAFALIVPPTAMMGATLPLLAKYVVRNDRELGPRIGFLYAVNTFGAVLGTLSAAFICLPMLGLGRTTWIGVAANLAVFALIVLGLNEEPVAAESESSAEEASDEEASDEEAPDEKPRDEAVNANDKSTSKALKRKQKRKRRQTENIKSPIQSTGKSSDSAPRPIPYESILWFAAISGAISFCYEIIFTRMLGHILGGSIFAFATMLAGFLLGIAIGGGIASRLATQRRTAATYFVYSQALTGIFALVAFWSINALPLWSLESLGGSHSTAAQVILSIVILLPSATCIGATFPLAIRVFARDQRDASRGAAKVYFWNTIGAIAGSLLTGMFLLPYLAYHGATILAVTLNAVLAVSLIVVMRIPKAHALVGLATLVCLLLQVPTPPENILRVSALPGPMAKGDFLFNQVGRSATVTVFDQNGEFRFQTNGLPEAAVLPLGAGMPFSSDGAWLAALPPLVRPGGESMLIVGLGGGTAASFVPPSIGSVDVFELEPAVVEANHRIRDQRRKDPLADPRIKIVLNDGRNGLALTNKRYDYIVSQPSHPWTAGASHLYTHEFNQIIKEHLRPGGIFLQWMDAQFIDEPLMRSMAAGLLDTFEHVRIYEPRRGSLMFIASDTPIVPENIAKPKLEFAAGDAEFYRDFGMIKPTDLLALLKMDDAAVRKLATGALPITDEFNSLAMRAPYLLSRTNAVKAELNESLRQWEPLEFHGSGLTEICPTVDYRALAIRMRGRTTAPSDRLDDVLTDPVEKALLASSLAQFHGNASQSLRELRQADKAVPTDPRPAFLILSNGALGILPQVDPEEQRELKSHLDDRYGKLMDAVLVLAKNDTNLGSLREMDALLASFEPDEIGYEHASRMRIVWRIRSTGSDRVRLGREALAICREAAPSMGPESYAYYQAVAAVQANEPYVALSTAMTFAKSFAQRAQGIKKGTYTMEQVQAMLPFLAQCRGVLADPEAFRSVSPQRYRSTTVFIDNLLAMYHNAASQPISASK